MDIRHKLKEFLKKETQKEISGDSENLLAANILDSFSMIKIIGFIESELKIKPNMEELTLDNFNSIETISRMIEKWRLGK